VFFFFGPFGFLKTYLILSLAACFCTKQVKTWRNCVQMKDVIHTVNGDIV
jgi:hypothetical protein